MVRYGIFVCTFTIVCLSSVATVDAGQRGKSPSICDEAGLIGAAYGACNAYCEALDCDDPGHRGSARACENSLARFMELTGELPPCEPACPCASGWLHPEFVPEAPEALSCFRESNDVGEFIEMELLPVADGSDGMSFSYIWLSIVDDDVYGVHGFECRSERLVSGVRTEDSGEFSLLNTFTPESIQAERQRKDLFESCAAVLEKFIEENEIECGGF